LTERFKVDSLLHQKTKNPSCFWPAHFLTSVANHQ